MLGGMPRRKLALALTGSGHLLTYQIGACRALVGSGAFDGGVALAAGSSGGAIAATLLACSSADEMDDYRREFVRRRGGGLELLREFLPPSLGGNKNGSNCNSDEMMRGAADELHVCATRNSDGSPKIFKFGGASPGSSSEGGGGGSATIATTTTDPSLLMDCVRASCTIPRSFHPVDVLRRQTAISYPEGDGVAIHDDEGGGGDDAAAYYCDGGIASPAPPVSVEADSMMSVVVVVVSPMVCTHDDMHPVICPAAAKSWLLRWMTPSLALKGGLRAQCSLQNARAAIAASGAASSSDLQLWYERGVRDAESFLDDEQTLP